MEKRKYFLYDRGWFEVMVDNGIVTYSGEAGSGTFSELVGSILDSHDDNNARVLSDMLLWLQGAGVNIKEDSDGKGSERLGDVDTDNRVVGGNDNGNTRADLGIERGDYEIPTKSSHEIRVDRDGAIISDNWTSDMKNKITAAEIKFDPDKCRCVCNEDWFKDPEFFYHHPVLGRININKEIEEYFNLQKKVEGIQKCIANYSTEVSKLADGCRAYCQGGVTFGQLEQRVIKLENNAFNHYEDNFEGFRELSRRIGALEKMAGELYGKTSANAKAIKDSKPETDYIEDLDQQLQDIGHQEMSEEPEIYRVALGGGIEVLLFFEGIKIRVCLPGETRFTTIEDLWWKYNHNELPQRASYKKLLDVLTEWDEKRSYL